MRRCKNPPPELLPGMAVDQSFPPPQQAAQDTMSMIAKQIESPIERLGRKLVDAAITRLEHCDPDRAVSLTNAYIALVSEDERARA